MLFSLGIPGSAVCRYSMKSLVKLFDDSQYLEEKSVQQRGPLYWHPVSPVNLSTVPSRPKVRFEIPSDTTVIDIISFLATFGCF